VTDEEAVAAVASGSHRPYFCWPCVVCGRYLTEGLGLEAIPDEMTCKHCGSKQRFSQDSILVWLLEVDGEHGGVIPMKTTARLLTDESPQDTEQ
jgi:hypothetical protein